ncbi:MAG: YafY family protein [Paraburkholderia sp.]|jgi:predicted DNA-binding transcriptional regulator YafY|uniref:helix-turn-helix transcriptional regulator n=1 Tax=Burkholderiaceae TaxID=119060 RepID=UPI0010F7F37A|nr:YafY family protein [Burkholderia sp. 4M9327F10]
MKSDRLISILLLLQTRGRLSTREIAEKLEVSDRTAYRDMESLCMAGVPLIAHRGSQGGWELAEGWKTDVPGLTSREIQGLLMSRPSLLGTTNLAIAAESGFEKLIASLPGPMQTQASAIRARLHIDPTDWWAPAEDLSAFPFVHEAVLSDRKINFTYTTDDESRNRTVDPLGMVCKQAIWYLVAKTPKGVRTYRLSRMSNIVVLATLTQRPSRFQLAKYWKKSTEELKEKGRGVRTTIALTAEAAKRLGSWVTYSLVEGDENGWLIFDVRFEKYDDALFFVLGSGSHAMVLQPAKLRKQVQLERMQACQLRKNNLDEGL